MAMGLVPWDLKCKDAKAALQYAIQHGATAFEDCQHAHHGLPAIQAIGGSVIYFVDDQHQPFTQHWNNKYQQLQLKAMGYCSSII